MSVLGLGEQGEGPRSRTRSRFRRVGEEGPRFRRVGEGPRFRRVGEGPRFRRVLGLGEQGEGPRFRRQGEGPRFRRAGWVRVRLGLVFLTLFTPGNPVKCHILLVRLTYLNRSINVFE